MKTAREALRDVLPDVIVDAADSPLVESSFFDEFERYRVDAGVPKTAKREKVGRGYIFDSGGDDVVYVLPDMGEVGRATRAFAEHYLKTGSKGEEADR